MNRSIVDAIHLRRRMRVVYHGRERLVEPQCYGIGHKGTELLRMHQIEGGSQREPLFDVAKCDALTVLEEVFSTPGPNYKRGDSAMKVIHCEL